MIKKLFQKVTNLKEALVFPLRTKKINEHLGAELVNLPDITKITTAQAAQLLKKINACKLIVIRGNRVWTEKEQLEFTAKLGVLEEPVVYTVNKKKKFGTPKGFQKIKEANVLWHCDNSFQAKPSHLSIFQMVKMPEKGSRTWFASLVHFYENLPNEQREKWKDYQVFYRDDVWHPLLWKHPFTGKDVVYFDVGYTRDIVDGCRDDTVLEVKEANEIVTYFNDELSVEPSLYVHQWKIGDIIIVDNYAVAHKEEYHMEDEERVMLRTTTEGIYF